MSLRSGFNRGVVTRATSAGVYVQMPDLYGTAEIGPLDFIGPKLRRPARSTSSAGHSHGGDTTGDGAHTHDLAQVDNVANRFATGDRVLVADVGPGDWVVLGRIETGANA
jgi:hypothetical protein